VINHQAAPAWLPSPRDILYVSIFLINTQKPSSKCEIYHIPPAIVKGYLSPVSNFTPSYTPGLLRALQDTGCRWLFLKVAQGYALAPPVEEIDGKANHHPD
jgi:hypothetical protein